MLFHAVIWNSHRSQCATEMSFIASMQWIAITALTASYWLAGFLAVNLQKILQGSSPAVQPLISSRNKDVNKIYLDWAAVSQDSNTDYVSSAWKWIHYAQKCLERKMLMIDWSSVWNLTAWALHPQQSQTAHPSHIQPGSEFFQPFWKPGISVQWSWAWLHIWLCPNVLKQKAWNN